MKYWIHADAEAELGDVAVYCATHASSLIAAAFLAEFEHVRDLLVENQQRGQHSEDDLRVYLFDRFPYSVIYGVDEADGPQKFAVAHQRRTPGFWRERSQ